ncbi:membrane dipeptidase, partial [Thermoproteota archaeon]
AEWIPKSGPYAYSWINWYVKELRDPIDWPKITEGLVARGYSDNEILKILGGNFMRVFKEVWDN